MRNWFLFLSFFIALNGSAQPINPQNIEIVRDTFGVPHIFAKTNREAVYGIGWAQCEDNFKVMQEFIVISKGLNGTLNGKNGAITDYIGAVFEMDKRIDERYNIDLSPEFHHIIEAYVAGINRYAETHPQEVLLKKIFPLTERDILKGFIFNFMLMNHSVADVAQIFTNKMELYKTFGNMQGAGSNAMAYSPNKTTDGKTYLVANPHQPTEGPSSFYELAVYTEEGWNAHGVTFIGGGLTPLIGSNKNLGWTHTTNYDDYGDVFQLTMNPKHKNQYRFDGQWKTLETKQAHLRVRLGKIVLPISKKYYTSIYGPAMKNKTGVYALRNNAFMRIGAAEEWYKMNLAKNFDEFWAAMKMQQIPCQTVTYADKEGTIFHLNNETMPVRNPHYNWLGIVPGDTSATLWNLDKALPIEQIQYIKNPKCGYVFNCNNSPFDMTDSAENLKPVNYSPTLGSPFSNTLRANRYQRLIKSFPKVSFSDAKTIRDDDKYQMDNLNFRQVMNLTRIYELDTTKYPDLKEVINRLKHWDGKCNIHSKVGSFMSIFGVFIGDYLGAHYAQYENTFPDSVFVKGLRYSRDFLVNNYGTLDVELGTMQKVVRGNKEMPMYGGIETIASATVERYGNNKVRMNKGDTFIMYAKYGKDGLEELKTTNHCGNSSNPKSPHYNDQMEMYVNKQPKTITMDKAEIYKQAVSKNHPQ